MDELEEQVAEMQRQLAERENVVEAVAQVRSQPFSKDQPQLWFALLEAQFAARKITSVRSMYNNALANLTTDVALQVQSIVVKPYEDTSYDNLKRALIQAYSISSTEKFQKLVSKEELGDQKPSHLLQRLRSYADDAVGDDFVKKLWLQRLPNTTRIVLSTSDDTLDKLAIMADTMHENSDGFIVSEIDSNTKNSLANRVDTLTQQIEKLAKKIKSMGSDGHNSRKDTPRRFRSRSKSNNRRDNNKSNNDEPTCWYHEKHGKEATKCRSPCKYSDKKN